MNFNLLFTSIFLFLRAYLPMLLALNILSGCTGRPSEDSAIKINGKTISTSQAPWAAALKSKSGGNCSGVFIDARTVLTAAHCVEKSDKIDLMIVDKNGAVTKGIKATSFKIYVHPKWISDGRGKIGEDKMKIDLAVVHFLDDQSEDFIKLAPDAGKINLRAEIFGFGPKSWGGSYGQLRVGIAYICSFQSWGFIAATTLSMKEATIPGDSGGPMVSNSKLVGILSATGPRFSYYVNLTSESSQSFLKDAWNDHYTPFNRDTKKIAGMFNWSFGAKLMGAKLMGADLREANLTGADLTGADLIGADLTSANLSSATLTGAYLTGANLTGADLTLSDLTNADLTKANLHQTKVNMAQLNKAYTTIPASALEKGLSPWLRHIPFKPENQVTTK